MPRYFFNTRIGDELISDPEGEDLRDPDRAWEVARAMIRELLRTEAMEAGLVNAILEVTDDAGEIVLEFPFTEALHDVSDVTKHLYHRRYSRQLRKCFRLRPDGKILKSVHTKTTGAGRVLARAKD